MGTGLYLKESFKWRFREGAWGRRGGKKEILNDISWQSQITSDP